MASGYLFVDTLTGHDLAPLATLGLVAGLVSATGVLARRKLSTAKNPLVPDARLSLRNLFELLAGFLIWLGDSAMGEENRKYLPFVATLFFFVFCLNIIGLIPGFVMPTDQFHLNLGIALTVFVLYNYWGIKEVGLINYLKHLWGPMFAIGPFMFLIELISHMVRPITLSLRLFGNMTGDHLALSVFTDLTRGLFIPIPVVFYLLGTIVCFMQAFVFALLTMIYIRFAVAHQEDH